MSLSTYWTVSTVTKSRSMPQFWSHTLTFMLSRVDSNILLIMMYFSKARLLQSERLKCADSLEMFLRRKPLHDYLQYHIPFTFVLVYQLPLLHICRDLLWKRYKHLLEMNPGETGGPSTGGRWEPMDLGKEEQELWNSFEGPESRAPTVNGRPGFRWGGVQIWNPQPGASWVSSCHRYLDEWKMHLVQDRKAGRSWY